MDMVWFEVQKKKKKDIYIENTVKPIRKFQFNSVQLLSRVQLFETP